jgi:hypothetical protein
MKLNDYELADKLAAVGLDRKLTEIYERLERIEPQLNELCLDFYKLKSEKDRANVIDILSRPTRYIVLGQDVKFEPGKPIKVDGKNVRVVGL